MSHFISLGPYKYIHIKYKHLIYAFKLSTTNASKRVTSFMSLYMTHLTKYIANPAPTSKNPCFHWNATFLFSLFFFYWLFVGFIFVLPLRMGGGRWPWPDPAASKQFHLIKKWPAAKTAAIRCGAVSKGGFQTDSGAMEGSRQTMDVIKHRVCRWWHEKKSVLSK